MAGFVQNAKLRATLLLAARNYARVRFWGRGPRVFINSIPKAGTHLLTTALEQGSILFNSREHIQMHTVNRLNVGKSRAYEVDIDEAAFSERVSRIRQGQFFTGHLFWDEGILSALTSRDVKTVFVIRDPRDILISDLHYISTLRRHPKRASMLQLAESEDEQFDLLLYGVPGVDGTAAQPVFRPLRQRLERYLGWIHSEYAMTCKFEDLVGERGGRDNASRARAFARLSDHLGVAIDPILGPSKSATFRKGRAFGWRSALSQERQRKVQTECGDLIAALGYEA